MKKLKYLLIFLLVALFSLQLMSCGGENNEEKEPPVNSTEIVDYVEETKLTASITGKEFQRDGMGEVKLLQAIDGDTIHVTDSTGTILKLRFLGINTPESTAKVEPWGVTASAFTKGIVNNAVSIVLESDGNKTNLDGYGRYLVWVWYKATETADYRLLNLELVQEGLSPSNNNSDSKRYAEVIAKAANQARNQKIKIWGEKEPGYCYDGASEISLKELKDSLAEKGNESEYYLQKVALTATVARIDGAEYYLIDTDLETGVTYGIQVYHKTSTGIMQIGVRVKLTGTVTYYEAAGVYQITDVVDKKLSNDVNNLRAVEENVPVVPQEISVSDLDIANHAIEFNLVTLKNLVVKSTYTTNTPGSSSNGAISIYCEVDGVEITVRTVIIVDRSGQYDVDLNKIVLASNFEGKTLDVTGIVEKYEGAYQIKLISMSDVVIR